MTKGNESLRMRRRRWQRGTRAALASGSKVRETLVGEWEGKMPSPVIKK